MDKQAAMAMLVPKRRAEAGGRYHHLHLYDGGSWDFDFVVPWTKSACRLDADLLSLSGVGRSALRMLRKLLGPSLAGRWKK